MDKKTIDNIVWYIPFKKLRNSLRDYLTELISIQNYKNNDLTINQYDNIINLLNKIQYFTERGCFDQRHIARIMGVEETVKYLNDNNINSMKILHTAAKELVYILSNEIEIDGLFLEFGVFKGNTINLMSDTLKDKIFYGFDSFEGLPEDWNIGMPKATFNLEGNLPKVNKNVTLIKGWFNETLPDFCKEHKEDIAFLHIDCDLYSSTKTIFDNLKDRIKPGTVITFDEYFGYYNWQNHEFKAFQEFVNENNIKFKYLSTSGFYSCSVKIL